MLKRIISLFLVFVLLIGTVPVEVFAQEGGTGTVATEPQETTPVETEPEESKPVETEPEESKPVETEPEESKPVETEPEESKPVETEPEESKPVETEPQESKPVETEPEESKPVETEPEESKPVETEPEETEPEETEPEETEPEGTEPEDEVDEDDNAFEGAADFGDGIAVLVQAKAGTFPDGAVLNAALVTGEDSTAALLEAEPNLAASKIFDLSVLDVEGIPVQPNGDALVTLTVVDLLADLAGRQVNTYYINPENQAQKLSCSVNAAEGTVSFVAPHFSIYAVTVSLVQDMAPAPEQPLPCNCTTFCDEIAHEGCEACAEDKAACLWNPEAITADRLAELMSRLPEPESISEEISDEELESLLAMVDEISALYDYLADKDVEDWQRVDNEYTDLVFRWLNLDGVLRDIEGMRVYDDANYDHPYTQGSKNNCTITLDSSMDATSIPTVIRFVNGVAETYAVESLGNGQYAFTRDDTTATLTYIVTGQTASGKTEQWILPGDTSAKDWTAAIIPEWAEFELFYLYSNTIPSPYFHSSNNYNDYGPSGDNAGMATIRVNLWNLRNMPGVVVGSGVTKQRGWIGTTSYKINYFFSPEYPTGAGNASIFWNSVLQCLDDNSKEILDKTGLIHTYTGFLLKNQDKNYGTQQELHGDGYLGKKYLAELYEGTDRFVGTVTSVEGDMKQIQDVLDLYAKNLVELNQGDGYVTWIDYPNDEDMSGVSTTRFIKMGYFYEMADNGTYIPKRVVVHQIDTNAIDIADTDINYVSQSSGSYYLAKFKMTVSNADYLKAQVIYKDGAEGKVFADISYPAREGGSIPAYSGPDLETIRPGHNFMYWSTEAGGDEFTNFAKGTVPNEGLTFYAVWQKIPYKVTWMNGDTKLDEDTPVYYGDMPTYDGEIVPSKASDAQYRYEFHDQWSTVKVAGPNDSKSVAPVTGDVVYYAQFVAVPQEYTVTWRNEYLTQNRLLKTDTGLHYGDQPVFGTTVPQLPDTKEYSYTFLGWSTSHGGEVLDSIPDVTGNAVYYACFEEVKKTYTVNWVDYDDTALCDPQTLEYGVLPVYPGTTDPSRSDENDAQYTYTFVGWSPEISAVTGNVTYTAQYEKTTNTYTVLWKDEDGTVLETDENVPYGTTPTFNGEQPAKADTQQHTYTFTGWNPQVSAVTRNAEYTAVYQEAVRTYPVTWVNESGQILWQSQVAYGDNPRYQGEAVANYESASYWYRFAGWSSTDDPKTVYKNEDAFNSLIVKGPMTFVTVFDHELKGYHVNVKVWLDATVENDRVTAGTPATIKEMMGSDVTLTLWDEAHENYYDLSLKQDNTYQSTKLVPNGRYYIYSSQDSSKPLSDHVLVVDNEELERNLFFYSVTYDLNGGSLNGTTAPIVTYHRGGVSVTPENPVLSGSSFLGWKMEGADQLLTKGSTITDDIQKPYVLVAQWGDAKVNVTVVVDHTHPNQTGSDPSPSGQMSIYLAYRRNAAEDYVHMEDKTPLTSTNWYTIGEKAGAVTTVNFGTVFDELDNNGWQYSANVFLEYYEVDTENENDNDGVKDGKTVTYDAATKTYHVTVYMHYNPALFNLTYYVATAPGTHEDLVPTAVDMKIYSRRGENSWLPISAHANYSKSLNPTRQKEETGGVVHYNNDSYPVPIFDHGTTPFFYRTGTVGLSFRKDGQLIELNTVAVGGLTDGNWSFESQELVGYYPKGAYTAVQTFTRDENNPEESAHHYGAHGEEDGTQHGQLALVVTAHPATLVLNLNNGTTTPFKTIENVFVVPDLTAQQYIPQAEEGFTFRGWYYDAKFQKEAKAGEFLKLDDTTTLYAKWAEDITVTGTVTVSNTYQLKDSTHTIPATERLSHVTVRVLDDKGLLENSDTAELKLSGEYMTGTYSVKVPDDGTEYTVSILQAVGAHYNDTYLNEPDSQDPLLQTSYGNYDADFNEAVTDGDNKAIVHAFMKFQPHTFDLDYTIDVTAIGDGYKPTEAKTLVMYDSDIEHGITWDTISQMIDGTTVEGQTTTLTQDVNGNKYPVWRHNASGTPYNYSVKLQEVTLPKLGAVTEFANQGFAVSYGMPSYAWFTGGEQPNDQSSILTITLTPKNYPITYVTNGGTMPTGKYPTVHIWSYATKIGSNTYPQSREDEGYTFGGWYDNAQFTGNPVDSIDAATAEAVTLYAKWECIPYDITYDLAGTTLPQELVENITFEGGSNPTTYTAETPFTLLNPEVEGYTFLGWTGTELDAAQKQVTVAQGSTGDRSYTAQWAIKEYTITIDVVHGTSTPNAAQVSVEHGDPLVIQFKPDDNYALDTVTVDGKPKPVDVVDEKQKISAYTFPPVDDDHTIRVVYSTDTNGDNTPDAHQAIIRYEVVNGEFKPGFVTQHAFDLQRRIAGVWEDVDTIYTLGNTLPVVDEDMYPIDGYQSPGYWARDMITNETVSADTVVTGNATYTYIFSNRIYLSVTYQDFLSGDLSYSVTPGIVYDSKITVDLNDANSNYKATWNNTKYSAVQNEQTGYYEFQLKDHVTLDAPSRGEHYVFRGWQVSKRTDDEAWHYTAQWEPKPYNIKYNLTGGVLTAGSPTTFHVESDPVSLIDPTRRGYVFDGWISQDMGIVEPTKNVTIPTGSIGDKLFTARWIPATDTRWHVQVYLETMNGNVFELDPSYNATHTGTTGDPVNLTQEKIPVITGFTYDSSRTETNKVILASGSTVLDLYYTRNSYTVTWVDEDGTELEKDTNVLYQSAPSFNKAEPKKESTNTQNFTFAGWIQDGDATNTVLKTADLAKLQVIGPTTFKASYTESLRTYTVAWLDYDGRTILERDDHLQYETPLSYGGSIPEREPDFQYVYTFEGWYIDGDPTLYTPETIVQQTVKKDVAVTASYKTDLRRYTGTVAINLDGKPIPEDMIQSALQGSGLYLGGMERTSADADTATQMMYHELSAVKSNGTFNGSFNTNQLQVGGTYEIYIQNGTGYAKITNSPSISIEAGHRTVTLDYYSVSYDLNGGTENNAFNKRYYIKGSEVKVANADPTRLDYYFKGWKLSKDAALLQKNAVVTSSITEPQTLTAQWSNVKVNVNVTVKHKAVTGNTTVTNNLPGNLRIELTHRDRNNPNATYVEVVHVEDKRFSQTEWFTEGEEETHKEYQNLFTASADLLDDKYAYSANVFVSGYTVESRTVTPPADNSEDNTYTVNVVLQYNPDSFNLTYTVKADSTMADSLVPKAADVKIYKKEGSADWTNISAHQNTSVDVVLNTGPDDATPREGSGTYTLPVYYGDGGNKAIRYYRIHSIGFTVTDHNNNELDLTTVMNEKAGNWLFTSQAVDKEYPLGAYTAQLFFTASEACDGGQNHIGAHGYNAGSETSPDYKQHGTLELEITAHPATITLDLNEGTINNSTDDITISNRFTVPDLSTYVPTRTDYTFQGWYDASNNPVVSGTVLDAGSKHTYTARWAAEQTISGNVTVSHENGDLVRAPEDWLRSVTVDLYEKVGDGEYNKVRSKTVNLTKEEPEYIFENVPNKPNTRYYIYVHQIGYTTTYDNGSVVNGPYAEALAGSTDERTVDVRMVPNKFDLKFQVATTAAGMDQYIQNAKVYILKDVDKTDRQDWKPVYAMQQTGADGSVTANPNAAITVELKDKVQKGNTEDIWYRESNTEAWRYRLDGYAYNYAMRLQSIEVDLNGNGKIDSDEVFSADIDEKYTLKYRQLPIDIVYRYPAFYKEGEGTEQGGQDIILRATMSPKTYTVTVDPNNGTSVQTTSRTWSRNMNPITLTEPTNGDLVFNGWEVDANGDGKFEETEFSGMGVSISASENGTTAQVAPYVNYNVTIRAKWIPKQVLAITGDTVYHTYDGMPHSYNVQKHPGMILGLPEGHTITGLTFEVGGINAGTYYGYINRIRNNSGGTTAENENPEYEPVKIWHNGKDVTHRYDLENFDMSRAYVTLVIHQAELTITAKPQDGKSFIYKGAPFTEFDHTITGLVNADQGKTAQDLGLTVTYGGTAATAVNAGTYSIVPKVSGIADNYKVKTQNGTLTIEPATLVPVLNAPDKTYDGSVHSAATVEIQSGRVDGDSVFIQAESITFPGKNVVLDENDKPKNQTVTASGLTITGQDKDNYTLVHTQVTSEAKINPREIQATIKAEDRGYDGTNEVRLSSGYDHNAIVDGDNVSVTFDVTGELKSGETVYTNAGTYDQICYDAPVLTGDDAHNYKVVTNNPSVTIFKLDVVITTAGDSKVYKEGEKLIVNTYTVEVNGGNGSQTIFESDLEEPITTLQTFEGEKDRTTDTDNTVTYKFIEGKEGNYNVTVVPGKLVVKADTNGNGQDDDKEERYQVIYHPAVHTSMTDSVIHDNLLWGSAIPAPPVEGTDYTVDTGYENVVWTLAGNPESIPALVYGDMEYEGAASPKEFNITYVMRQGDTNPDTNPRKYTYGQGVDRFDPPEEREDWLFMGWYRNPALTPDSRITVIPRDATGDYTLYPRWEADVLSENPETTSDGIPDIYQALVNYRVVNGYWSMETGKEPDAKPRSYVLTFADEDENGNVTHRTTKLKQTASFPDEDKMVPAQGYTKKDASWSPKIADDTPLPRMNTSYTFTYGDREDYTITLTVLNGTAKVNGTTYEPERPVVAKYGDKPTLSFTANEGYALDTAQIVDEDTVVENITLEDGEYQLKPMTKSIAIKVVFSEDQWNAETDETNSPDGIPDNRQAKVVYQSGDVDKGNVTGKTTQIFTIAKDEDTGDYIGSVTPDKQNITLTPANTGYVLDHWLDGQNTSVSDPFAEFEAHGGMAYTFTAQWLEDDWLDAEKTDVTTDSDSLSTPDGIADVHQVAFRYVLDGQYGSFAEDAKTLQIITLENGAISGNVTPERFDVNVQPGYLPVWTESMARSTGVNPFAEKQVEGRRIYTFTLTFAEDLKTVTFNNAEDLKDNQRIVQAARYVQVDPNGGKWKNDTNKQTVQITADITLEDAERDGYLFLGWKCTEGPGQQDGKDIRYIFTAQWAEDANGDDMMDKYQKKVTFRIVNGVWGNDWFGLYHEYAGTDDDIVLYLTLEDADGNYSETGTALLEPYIPSRMRANRGYYRGHWDVDPPETVTGSGSVTYIYRYKRIPSGIPQTGDGFDMHMWAGFMTLSMVGILALMNSLRKDKKKRSK